MSKPHEKIYIGPYERICMEPHVRNFMQIIQVLIVQVLIAHSYRSDGKMLKTFYHTKDVFSKRLFLNFIFLFNFIKNLSRTEI
jgi:hypothetical protein